MNINAYAGGGGGLGRCCCLADGICCSLFWGGGGLWGCARTGDGSVEPDTDWTKLRILSLSCLMAITNYEYCEYVGDSMSLRYLTMSESLLCLLCGWRNVYKSHDNVSHVIACKAPTSIALSAGF